MNPLEEFKSRPLTAELRYQMAQKKMEIANQILSLERPWTKAESWDLIMCCNFYPDHAKLIGDAEEIALELLEMLAFDPRMHEAHLPMLEDVLRQVKEMNLPTKNVTFNLFF